MITVPAVPSCAPILIILKIWGVNGSYFCSRNKNNSSCTNRNGSKLVLISAYFGLLSAYFATFFVDINILTLILSFSPGGIYEVAVIAIAFDLDPDFVAFHHIIRLLFILFTVPIFLRILEKIKK